MHRRIIGLALASGLVLTACGDDADSSGDAENYPTGAVRWIAPADPGSGWDLTARAVTSNLTQEGIVTSPMPVENRPGAAGAVFFAEMVEQREGQDDIVALTSMAMSVNTAMGQTPYSLTEDATLIAGIATEHFVVVVAEDSEYQDLNDVAGALRTNAGAVPVGAAVDDQFPFNLLMHDVGVDPGSINYVAYEGGGEQSTALLSGDIQVAIAGYSELQPLIEGGQVRGIAILGEERVEGVDIPTAIEQGIDVELTNWRGLYGPPGMPEHAVEFWADAIEELVETDTWQATVEQHDWTTQFLRGEEFEQYVQEIEETVIEGMALVGEGR